MQKGVFTTWIKELCALVFVQTIQAFILAIVLSIILTFIAPTDGKITSQDSVSALGVLCIVLLTSLTKMEQITKKIFGLDSSLLQNKPPHGLMASFMALKAAGRAFNNIPKIASGVSGIVSARTSKKKLETNKNKRLAGMLDNSSNSPGTSDSPGSPDSSGAPDSAGSPSSPSSGGGASATSGTRFKNGYNQKDLDNYLDKYEEQLSALKKQKKEARNKIMSGVLETGGAITGAFGGAAVGLSSGLATGDLDQIPKAIGFGVGVGDVIGEGVSNVIQVPGNIKSSIQSNAKAGAALRKSQEKLIDVLGDAYQGQKNIRITKTKQQKQIDEAISRINNSIDNI